MITTLVAAHALSTLLATASAAGEGTTLSTTVNAIEAAKGGMRIRISRGSSDGVEYGDHGAVLDGKRVVTRFSIDGVAAKYSWAFVPLHAPEVSRYKQVSIELTPGTTPAPLASREIGAGALGSCASDYTMYKDGRIATWTPGADGFVKYIWIEELGWKHRVCGDSTGMIYQGDQADRFVTDGSNVKVRLRIHQLGWRYSVAEVIQGKIPLTAIDGSSKRVVFRAKK